MNRVHVVVAGRVQGVYFRQSARLKALKLGVSGWVRNRNDGSVEMVAEGPASAIDQLVEWCGSGPEMARVESVERVDEDPVGIPEGFDVRPTM